MTGSLNSALSQQSKANPVRNLQGSQCIVFWPAAPGKRLGVSPMALDFIATSISRCALAPVFPVTLRKPDASAYPLIEKIECHWASALRVRLSRCFAPLDRRDAGAEPAVRNISNFKFQILPGAPPLHAETQIAESHQRIAQRAEVQRSEHRDTRETKG